MSLYVDDWLIAGSSTDLVLHVKQELSKRFEMIDCGESKTSLGLEIARIRNRRSSKICRFTYALNIFERFNMQDCKPVSTPAKSQIDTAILIDEVFCSTKYRKAVGIFKYLIISLRPGITFSVGRLLQFMEKPTTAF